MGQRFGYANYDFFGVAPRVSSQFTANSSQPTVLSSQFTANSQQTESEKEYEYDPKHQYAGVTRFKQGFGGEYHEDPGTFDLIISPKKYRVYGWLRSIRRIF